MPGTKTDEPAEAQAGVADEHSDEVIRQAAGAECCLSKNSEEFKKAQRSVPSSIAAHPLAWRWDAPYRSAGAESLRGRLLPARLRCANLPSMSKQTESPTDKPGDRCPLCGKGTLVASASGKNLLCHACNRITVVPEAHKPDARPDAAGPGHARGRPRKAVRNPQNRPVASPR